jgi:hypothetical protein
MPIFDVLAMQIRPFESRRQEKHLNAKLKSFQIMTHVPI